MDLPPFLLDHWLAKYDFADPPIAYNLASSTGPRWTLDALLALGPDGDDLRPDLGTLTLSYAPPEGSHALRAAIADFHGVDPDWVVVTTGASEALSVLFCLAERAGGHVLIPDPAYPAYAAMAQAWRLGVRTYALDRADGFAQRADPILGLTDADTALALVNTPHNPSGSAIDPAERARLAAGLADRGIPLIVDEVYHPLYFGTPLPSAATTDNVIVVSDMSKALSLPGLRMGWIIDRDPERRARIIDARSYFTVSGSPLLEAIAAHALRNRAHILARLEAVAIANIAGLAGLIGGSGGKLAWSQPRGGTTAFPWFADGRDSRPFCEALAAAGVLVAPGDCFGHPAHIRVGVAQQADGFDVALDRFAQVLRDY
jgi:aspartate/methionine/tyrosine aminotransferase